jgi:alkanesulfonate monooxygenase SsuD/methylene tetrahydromethanopterin reductase-like flavin-dependent oxidoreductase (luciferase family)
LSFCLASTRRLIGVSLVLANPLRNPALVAKMAIDLQNLSGGRLVLGIGSGGSDQDVRAYGLGRLSQIERLRRLEEALRLIRGLFRGELQNHQGAHYTVDGLRLDHTSVPPPILVGGHGPRLLGIAARHADVVNAGFDKTVEEWGRLKARLDAERSSSALAEERLVLSHNMSIAETGEVDVGMVDALIRVGVSWFFLLFPDVPSTRLLESVANQLLPRFRVED